MEIYGTMGPSCKNAEVLYKLIGNGMTGIRLNLSHAMLPDFMEGLEELHKACKLSGKNIDIMADIEGPELRIGALKENMNLTEGSYVLFATEEDENTIPVMKELLEYIDKETEVLLDDGKILLNRDGNAFKVIRGGVLSSKKSIKLVNNEIKRDTLTVNDFKNISAFKKHNINKVMLPFVRNADDVKALRTALTTADCINVEIYSKIENEEGYKNIDGIMEESDFIVIARGDLGNAFGLTKLPIIQEEIVKKCKKADKPFLIVTDLLASMCESKLPTRAETSDIFRAVVSGAKALMLTNETAIGKNPTDAMKVLKETVNEAMSYMNS